MKQLADLQSWLCGAILIVGCLSAHPIYAQSPNEDKFTELAGAPSLPELPEYPEQHQFSSGIEFPNMPGGTAYILRFATQQKSEKVVQWYASAFPLYGWTVKSSSTHSISAKSKSGNYCTIRTLSPMPGEKHAYAINFKMRKR